VIKILSWLRYLFCPTWRRDYKLNRLLLRGKSAQDAMVRLGIIGGYS